MFAINITFFYMNVFTLKMNKTNAWLVDLFVCLFVCVMAFIWGYTLREKGSKHRLRAGKNTGKN